MFSLLTPQMFWLLLFAVPLLYYVLTSILSIFAHGLRSIPGPFLAKFSRLWNLRMVASRQCHLKLIEAHEKYGPIVRTGPWHISVADPSEIPKVLGVHSKMVNFYDVFAFRDGDGRLQSTFNETDPARHALMRSAVSQLYSMSSMRQLEPMIEECTKIFMGIMSKLSSHPVDLGEWLQFYAFDVIGAITFNRRFGFLEEQRDIGHMIAGLDQGAIYLTYCGQVPELHPYLFGGKTLSKLQKWFPSLNDADPMLILREFTGQGMHRYDTEGEPSLHGGFVSWLRRQQKKDQSRLTDRDIYRHCLENVGAGSDTTAIALRAIIYYTVKNPRVYQKMVAEIDEFDKNGLLSPFVSFDESLKMPYLQAVMKESMRLHPSVGFQLERVVPVGGVDLCGKYVPAGTFVGINAFVVHRDRRVYGEDALAFRPERWLEASADQLRLMDRTFIAFGAGTRTCLGKNISLMEMGKVVPQLFRTFDIEWSSPHSEWTIDNLWFAKQKGVIFTLRLRKDKNPTEPSMNIGGLVEKKAGPNDFPISIG